MLGNTGKVYGYGPAFDVVFDPDDVVEAKEVDPRWGVW